MPATRTPQTALDHILTLAAELTTAHSLKETLAKIIRAGTDLLDCDSVGILLHPIGKNGDEAFLHFIAAAKHENSLTQLPIPIGASIAGHVFLNGETVHLQNAHLDNRYYAPIESVTGVKTGSLLAVPIDFRDKRIGVIEAQNKHHATEFTPQDIRALTALAAYAAVAIEHARMMEGLEMTLSENTATLRGALTHAEWLNQQLQNEIREREQVENELRKLSIAVEQSPISITITDLAGKIEYVNPAFTQLTGYTLEEILGANSNVLQSGLTPRENYMNLWQTLLRGETWRGEFTNKKKNGEIYWEQATIAPIRNTQGHITHYIAIKQDVTSRKLYEQELQRLSTTDPLTGLFNRRQFYHLAQQAFKTAKRAQMPLAALILDADHFKHINDRYGHAVGDEVLQKLAQTLQNTLRESDVVARYGGEEFVCLLPNTNLQMAQITAERVLNAVRMLAIPTTRGELRLSISIGISVLDFNDNSVEPLLNRADAALYRAKQNGRDQYAIESSFSNG